MLDHELGGGVIDLDQEISGRVKGDETLRKPGVQVGELALLLRAQGLGHGVDRRQP